MREFSTAGPIIPEDHHYIAPLARLDRDDLLRLIARHRPGVPPRPARALRAVAGEDAGLTKLIEGGG